MTKPHAPVTDDEVIDRSLMRLNAAATAIGSGLLSGLLLFTITIVLALRDGPAAGPHLGLLAQYFPGYSVTVAGSVVGFCYAAVVGGAAGYLLAAITSRLTR